MVQTHDRPADQYGLMLRASVLPTVVVGVLAVVAAVVLGDARDVLSAAMGALVVLVFFSLSLLVMRGTADLAPNMAMAVVLVTYTMKIMALAIFMLVFRRVSWVSGPTLAQAMIGCTVVWLAFEMRAFTKLRILVAGSPVAPGSDAARRDGPS